MQPIYISLALETAVLVSRALRPFFVVLVLTLYVGLGLDTLGLGLGLEGSVSNIFRDQIDLIGHWFASNVHRWVNLSHWSVPVMLCYGTLR